MTANRPIAIILTGDGINCEQETARAFSAAGAESKVLHLEEVFTRPEILETAAILVFPGGFSYGDELGSGKVLALKLKRNLQKPIQDFVAKGGLVLGICNGFQMLVKMGLLPFADFQMKTTLTHNLPHGFQDRHVDMVVQASPCVWLKGMQGMTLNVPIRHGEGRFLIADQETENRISELGLNCLTYNADVNGSWRQLAGLCDPSGRILGLMPHPEVFFHEDSRFQLNQKIFQNAVSEAGKLNTSPTPKRTDSV